MKLLSILAILFSFHAIGADIIEVGQSVPDKCWQNASEQEVCLSKFDKRVRVLIFSAGWCPSCNEEMEALVPRLKEVKDLPVTFLSLSTQGWEVGTSPDSQFLKEWTDEYAIPFPVLASPKDPGKAFFKAPYTIPAIVIVDRNGKLAFKKVVAEVDEILSEVKRLGGN